MAQLVRIGKGARTHYRANGTGPVPAGRARCEIDADLSKPTPHYTLSEPRVESPAYDASPGEPTCHWCRTRALPD
jgi:hypothetical protein